MGNDNTIVDLHDSSTPSARLDTPGKDYNKEPIAIIGLGCRFPGANGPQAFWSLLQNGVDAITEIPSYRYDVDTFYDPTPGIPGKIITRYGGFLENADLFDPAFFHISPREALRMDPQQRLLLEVAWEAVEDAGQAADKLGGSSTGVFVAVCSAEYADLQTTNILDMDIYSCAGCARSVLSGRLSYILGLQGPSVVVDTACSSSLVAVHLACQSLRCGECTLAIAGGTNLLLTPVPTMGFSQAGMLSPDGHCKAFDASANGYVRSEGVGVVILKPLSLAQRDGDPIYAVILGSAVNNDGKSAGLLAPAVESQEMVLSDAYRDAGVSPGSVHYVEAHGTGTVIGDYVELTALGKVLSTDRPKDRLCKLGSVKTNIGHSEAASGVAALIKVALSLKHKAIPASLHFREPNPNIDWDEIPLRVQTELGAWPVGSELPLAGISSFGMSGTNVHVVLQAAPPAEPEVTETQAATDNAQLLTISANSPESLSAMAHSYQEFLAEAGGPSLRDICRDASKRRKHHDHRLSLAVHSKEEAVEFLKAFEGGEARRGMSQTVQASGDRPRMVFIYSGTGSQRYGMGQQLFEQEPVFRDALLSCDRLMRQETGWSLIDKLTTDESWLHTVDVMQPAIFAIQVALTALWRHWGIVPDVVVGQSMGEVASAHVSGALSLEEAVTIICRRGRVLKKVSGLGSAASVELSLEQSRQILRGYEGRLSIASSNSPTSTVLAGSPEAINEILEKLQRDNIFCRLIKVDFASHSSQLDDLREDLRESLNGIKSKIPSVPIYSTVTGDVVQNGDLGADYWARNLREPVLFSPVVERLIENDHTVFVEVSPHPVLLTAIQQTLDHHGKSGTLLASLRENADERDTMVASLGALYTAKQPVNWDSLYPEGGPYVGLPGYEWHKERFWLKDIDPTNEAVKMRLMGRVGSLWAPGHPLLGQHLRVASSSTEHIWQQELDIRLLRYLADHSVQGIPIFPAVGWVEAAIAASKEALGQTPTQIEHLSFKRILPLSEDKPQVVQILFSQDGPGEATFRAFSSRLVENKGQTSWTLHATGVVRLGHRNDGVPAPFSIEEIQARCSETVPGTQFYEMLKARGFEYGPKFQALEMLWRQDGESLGRLRPIDSSDWKPDTYFVYPGFLDSCVQVIAGALPRAGIELEGHAAYLPVAFTKINIHGEPKPGTEYWSHALLDMEASKDGDVLRGDVTILDEGGQVIIEILGIELKGIKEEEWSLERDSDDWLYEIQWQAKPHPPQDVKDLLKSDQSGAWLILADDSGVAQRLCALIEAHGDSCAMVYHDKGTAAAPDGESQNWRSADSADELQRALEEHFKADATPYRGIIHMWSLDAPSPEDSPVNLEVAHRVGCASVLNLIQALAKLEGVKPPPLWLVTNGVHAVSEADRSISVAQSPVWGMGRAIFHEHPELQCKLIDLGSSSAEEELASLFEELQRGDVENQISLRGEERYVARLMRVELEDSLADRTRVIAGKDEPFQVEMIATGILENLILRGTKRTAPSAGEVEIQVAAAGLNFMDVMLAMGILPGRKDMSIQLGKECSGRIVAVGEGVERLQVGQEVIAIVPHSLSKYSKTNYRFVVPKPDHISSEEAATIPITYLTAYYSLCNMGRLRGDERVLIHSAAGGVGLAALQIAQHVGAEIFATAGSQEKRDLLRSLGVQHVMDSRSFAFAEEIMEITRGEGVDVILNSLAGEAIPKSLSVLRGGGRFLEIGKRDIYQNKEIGLRAFCRNQSFHAIDLDLLIRERPDFMSELMNEVLEFFREEKLRPIHHQVFPISKVENAFRYMAQGKHIGKIVLSLKEQDVPILPLREQSFALNSDATYLITGGYGGLGLAVAQWMIEGGARHLALLGRNGPSDRSAQIIKMMTGLGIEIFEARADVGDFEQLQSVIDEIEKSMPALKGIVHAAGTLDDGFLLQLDQQRFKSVMVPKVNGGWNLHLLTRNIPLDFFVVFSSATSVLGSPGQSNYAAANAFLDSLAFYRQRQGLAALSINWGAWSEVGLAARADTMSYLSRAGMQSFRPTQGVKALEYIIQQNSAQLVALPVKWNEFFSSLPAKFQLPLLSQIAREGPQRSKYKIDEELLRKLLAAQPEERTGLIESYMIEQSARVLGFSQSQLDPVKPLTDLGLDSLMALEMKNRVESSLGITLPISALLQGPSIREIAGVVSTQLSVTYPQEESQAISEVLEEVMQLSEEEAEALLQSKLESAQLGTAPEPPVLQEMEDIMVVDSSPTVEENGQGGDPAEGSRNTVPARAASVSQTEESGSP
jgi:acyl transferase domain-containing protein/acyl carrier protein